MKPVKIITYTILTLIATSSCESKKEKLLQGKIKRESLSFTPKVTGRLVKLFVHEGQSVKTGDTLAILDVPEVSAKIAQAKGIFKASSAQRLLASNGATENQLKQLYAKQAVNREQFEFAQKSYTRASAMFSDSLLSPQAYDESYAKFQSAKSQLDAVTAELNEAVKGTRFEAKITTVGQNEQAGGVLMEAEIAYSERYIIATNNMTVETITIREGELATAGYPVFSGYIPNSTWFRFTIPESSISAVKKGQKVTVNVAYNKKSYPAEIINIKQLPRYADITTAYPDYEIDDAVYELKILPENISLAEELLYNATITLDK